MELDKARAFVRENHRAVLATHRRDGHPQLSPVVVAVDDDGYVTVSSRQTAMKVHNMLRDPRVSLCVFPDKFFGPWVQIDGTASIVALPEAMDGLIENYRAVAGEHPNWDEFRMAMARERRVLVRVAVARAGPDRSG
jgi:PPOX class probable F420-dependent enzyme